MAAIQLRGSDWEAGFVMPGFPIPPIGKLLGCRMESHDPVAGVPRVSFPTKPEDANPGGAVTAASLRRSSTPSWAR
jgi:hypothetical protein